MGKTIEVAADRAHDNTKTVLPAEVARGTHMENPPGLAGLKLMHAMIGKAGGRMGDDVEHRIRLSEIREIEGMRHHDRASLRPLFKELQAAVIITDDFVEKVEAIGGLLDIAQINYSEEDSGELVISWYFSRMFTRMAAASDHWAILDRQTAFRLRSRYSMLLFQYVSSLVNLKHTASKIFTVAELRTMFGVEPGKLERFADFNARAIQPAIEEISAESRFTLTATPRKTGRTVTSVEISWTEKTGADRKNLKAELDRHSAGRKARRAGNVEEPVIPFPESGGFRFSRHWRERYEATWKEAGRPHSNLPDSEKVADRVRTLATEQGIALDSPRMTVLLVNVTKNWKI